MKTRDLPLLLQIEPVGLRIGECDTGAAGFCPHGQTAPRGEPVFMHINVFRSLLDGLPPGAELHMLGRGDPLLHLHLFEMVRHAVSQGLRVTLHTGLQALSAARAAECVESGLHALHFRLAHAGDRPEKIARALRNLRRLMQAKAAQQSHLEVRMDATVSLDQAAGLPALVELAHGEGMRGMTVRLACAAANGGLPPVEPQEVRQHFDRALDSAARLGVELVLPALHGARRVHQPRLHGRRRCDPPWREDYVGHDGTPIPLCPSGSDTSREGVSFIPLRSAQNSTGDRPEE